MSDCQCKVSPTNSEVVKKKLCIVGCSNSRTHAPWDDPEAEFMGVNNLFLSEPNRPWASWSEIHYIDKDEKGNFRRRGSREFRGQDVNDYLKCLANLKDGNGNPIPIYMQKKWDEVPNSVEYPIQKVLSTFGDYFTNSISYMIALGLLNSKAFGGTIEEINISGVDMAVSSKLLLQDEYSHQRPSCEYMIGVARGLGIRVVLPDTSDLLKTRFLYGYDEPKADRYQKKMEEMLVNIHKGKDKAEMQKMDAQRKIDQSLGAELAIKETLKIWQ